MLRRTKSDAGDGEFKAKMQKAIKKKSLLDVQQLLRDQLPRSRQTAKKCALPDAFDDCLLLAMVMGHNDIIEPLLKIGVNVNAADGTDETALFKAANDGDHTLVKLLIQHGADATIVGKKARYPLKVAIEHDDVTTVSLLLDAGANANHIPANRPLRESVLFTAVHRRNAEIAKLLLDAGADANHQNKHGESVLFAAIRCENLSLVQLLLSHCADANYAFVDKKGKEVTTYALAVQLNKPAIVDVLVSHGAKDYDVETLYSMLVYSGCPKPKRGSQKHKEEGALFKAARFGSIVLVNQLLQCGTDVNSTEDGYEERTALFAACERRDIKMITLFLDHNADVNHRNKYGDSPLHLVINGENTHEDIVRLLLDHGADVSRKGYSSALASALRNHWSVNILRLLLERGADVNKHCCSHTPVYYAVKSGDIDVVRLLLEHGADVNKDKHEHTPLFIACARDDIDMVRLLLDNGADVNVGSLESTPLKYACNDRNMELVYLLLRHNNKYSTPLLCAISAGNVGVVRHILNTGADANVSTSGYCNHALKTAAFQLLYRPSKNCLEAFSEIIALIIGQCNSFEYDRDWRKPNSWFPPVLRPEFKWPRKTTGGKSPRVWHLHDRFFGYPTAISCLLPCLDAELQLSPERLSLCRMLLGHGVTDEFSSIFKLIHRRGMIDIFKRDERAERIQPVTSQVSRKQQDKSRIGGNQQACSRVLRKRKPIAESGTSSKPKAESGASSRSVDSDPSSMPLAKVDVVSKPISKPDAVDRPINQPVAVSGPEAEPDALSRSFVRAMILAGVDFSGLDALEIDKNISRYTKVDTDLREYAEYLAMVNEEVELMPSLQDRCVVAVRKYLSGGDMWTKVDSLPLPKPLQDLLKLTNV